MSDTEDQPLNEANQDAMASKPASASENDEMDFVVLTEEEKAARARRNRAIALGLLAFIGLIFVTTVLRLSYNYNHGG